jgi:uncharacterized protein with HEPN domain
MRKNDKNIFILRRILRYCDDIATLNAQFGNTKEALATSIAYRHSTAMCILQIGELTKKLSDEF